jgi:putative heme-binding domain-containing protein
MLQVRPLVFFILLAWPLFPVLTAEAEDFPLVVEADPLLPQEQQKKFHLPPGFEIQLVAAEPDVRKPINLNFDHAGRLYFSQSVEYPFAAAEGAKPRDTVRVIEGIGADGRAEGIRTAVDGLNIPIGVLPLADRLLVFSIPNIYSCRDQDGDGRYEQQDVLFGPFGQRDTHGLNNGFTRGLDGWIYACHGFSNDSKVHGRDGNVVAMNSGNTYRFRADGSRIEHYTHGQVNPFGMCFDPAGNLFTADCHTLPAYMVLRGAYYPSFGKPHDGLGFGPAIMSHSHGSTGIAGVVYYAAEHFPPEYRDTLFIGNPITHRVNHDKLEWHGSTPKATEQPDFLKCDDPWFRPVDLKLGPDGALYIADFYNRIIGHYEVDLHHPGRDRERGRIWRVVYKGTPEKPIEPPTLPDLASLGLDALIERLADANLVVRTMATHELIDHFSGPAATRLAALLGDAKLNTRQRSHAAYVLAAASAQTGAFERLWTDADPKVRVHAVRAAAGSKRATPPSAEEFIGIARRIEEEDPTVARAAAECFGGMNPALAAPLLAAWKRASKDDTQLIHAIRIGLRDCFSHEGAYERGASAALAKDPENRGRIADISLGIPQPAAAEFVLSYLAEHGHGVPRFAEILGHAVRFLPADRLPPAFQLVEDLRSAPALRQRAALVAVYQALEARGQAMPAELAARAADVAARLLLSERERQVTMGAELARQLKLAVVRPQLERVVTSDKFPSARVAAIDACVACDPAASVPMLAALAGDSSQPMALRQKAAQGLGAVNNGAAHRALVSLLGAAPASLAGDLAAGLAGGKDAAEMLIAAIEFGQASAQVLHNPQVAVRLKQIANQDVQDRIAKLVASLPAADERIRILVGARIAGFSRANTDVAVGKQVFTKTCAACHKIGGEGTKIGPDLDGIGNRGAERLVEDILEPSRNVDQAFRTTLISTNDGRSVNGLVLREEGQVIVLADNQGKEIRVAADNVLEGTVSPLSPMPANVAEQLEEQEFYDLLAFLLAHDRQADLERGRQGDVSE